jgi:undecaprenyl-phosphate 4-deoxy-4-formamido-L-arabinose transferase
MSSMSADIEVGDVLSCSVVIPVYNSEDTLVELVSRLSSILPGLFSDYEVILVNDGSQDNSLGIANRLAVQFSWVKVLNLLRNYGQHNTLLCGIRAAQYQIIVTMDDDLQHPPEEIHKLVTELAKGYEVVYGYPLHETHGLWRNLASQVTKLALQSTMGAETARHVGPFRVFYSRTREAFSNYQNSYVNLDVLLTWGSARFSAIPVEHARRQAGQSNYTIRKLVTHAVNMITGFSIIPLQVASLMGFSFAIFGMLVLIYVVGRYLIQGGSVPGFPFLASTIAIFSGVQLFALGIIGEYLARMHFRLSDQPPYVIGSNQTFDADDRS